MKILLKRLLSLSLLFSTMVLAEQQESKAILQAKLAKIAHFSASFSQQVIDDENNILQNAAGTLVVQKPNLVNWHTQTPDELLIISDGSSLWFYDPFIEQVTAYKVNQSVANTPILLLSSNEPSLWDNYRVDRVNETEFAIHALNEQSRVKSLILKFEDNSNRIAAFTIVDATGQISKVLLSNYDTQTISNPSLFRFSVPEGVDLDDQR